MNMEKTVCKEVWDGCIHIWHIFIIIFVTGLIPNAIVIVMVEVVDAYECRTGIEEGGVKKTIVVRTIPAIYNLYYKIHNTRNIQNLQYAKSRSMRGQISM